ncbi:unnamed protein product [Phaeothamnion confervicola]
MSLLFMLTRSCAGLSSVPHRISRPSFLPPRCRHYFSIPCLLPPLRDRRPRRSHSNDGGDRRRDRSPGGRGGGGDNRGGGGDSRDGGGDGGGGGIGNLDFGSLYKQVVQQGREHVIADGKNYAARPTSYKSSLSLKIDRYTHRRKSASRSPDRDVRRAPARRRSPDGRGGNGGGSGGGRGRSQSPPPPPPRRMEKVTAESLRRMEDLKRRYGDASAHK